MLRHRAFVLLTLIHITIQISAEQTIYPDGWIPMSQNDIYEQIRREVDSKTDVSTEKTVDVITAATSNTYEVTERIDTSPAEDSYTTESTGYQYNPPTDENQNLTSTFYRILSKYNIKTGDKLPNYELSLQRKVQNPSRDQSLIDPSCQSVGEPCFGTNESARPE
ncbi:unnamed protein product [Spodoptera exigua]|nr:unnamed protein product [Spodoptera exigua]